MSLFAPLLAGDVGMSGRRFNGLFESLEASFEAAEGRAEREAATDLAMSLRQDRSLVQVLRQGGWVLRGPDQPPEPIAAVGIDYLETEHDVMPLGAAVIESGPSQPPRLRRDSLIEVLRGWARRGHSVRVSAGHRTVSGRLEAVGRDHLVVASPRGRVLVPCACVERVTRRPGSSVDEP
jgi:hypothetical protein